MGSILRETIDREGYAALYDTVEREGIYVLDPFDRPRKRTGDSEDGRRALKFIIDVYAYETGATDSTGDDHHPMDVARGPHDLTEIFGWTENVLPVFAQTDDAVPVRKEPTSSGQTKKLQSSYLVIGAFASLAGLDLATPGIAGQVHTENIALGFDLDHKTVKSRIDEAAAEIARRLHE